MRWIKSAARPPARLTTTAAAGNKEEDASQEENAMTVQALGYLGIRAKDLTDWGSYGTGLLGLQRIDKSRSSLAFRMDDRKQRLIVDADGGEGIAYFGWEVKDAAALDALAAKLDANGIKFARGSRALADERRVADLIVLNDPLGYRVEVLHGAEVTTDPFMPGRNISGFRTGPLGMGHVVLMVDDIDKMVAFYDGVLGFQQTDYFVSPYRVSFYHVNSRHHSLAFVELGTNGVHHMMVELFSFDDVGQGYDVAQMEQGRVTSTLGRHINDRVTSFYTRTPSGFHMEYGWGGRVIEMDGWQPSEYVDGPSAWGHDRTWLNDEEKAVAKRIRMEAAQKGVRNPVQVIEGNYNKMPGVCPWFDQVSATSTRKAG
jgi:2,3-dihydroxybiphenyl 1,2-dioxygenase